MIGMRYKILPTKEFRKSDSNMRKRVKSKIEDIAENPTRHKQLHYDLKGSCRLWIGKLRIIFSYDKEKQKLYLEKIVFGHNY